MNIDPREHQRIEQELKNLQAAKNQYVHERDNSREIVKHYGSSHPTAQINERKAQEYDRKIEQLDREISRLMSCL